jgi:polo-like kinase 4
MGSIEDYDVGQLIGRGAFAVVLRARRRGGRRGEVALKVIRKADVEAINMTPRVNREQALQSKLSHENIIALYDFFEDAENYYLCQEVANYGTLYRFLQIRGPLPQQDVRPLVLQLLRAVNYLHSRGIVHRDIKLSNILISEMSPDDPQVPTKVKLCDFGLATRIQHPDEEHYTICGTPNYIAPEIASQQAHGLPVDLWALGVVFYCILLGRAPFEARPPSPPDAASAASNAAADKGATAQAQAQPGPPADVFLTIQRITTGQYQPPPPSVLSEDGLSLLRALLEVNPLKRAGAASLLSHAFFLPSSAPAPASVPASASASAAASVAASEAAVAAATAGSSFTTVAVAEVATRPAIAKPVPPVAETVTAPDVVGM